MPGSDVHLQKKRGAGARIALPCAACGGLEPGPSDDAAWLI